MILFAVKVNGQDSVISKSYNQFLIEEVNENKLKRKIVSDTIKYELRLWICNCFPCKLIQITKDFNNNWNYRLGYFKHVNNIRTFEFQDSIIKAIDWDLFERKLRDFIESNVQNQIELKISKDGKTYLIKNEDFFNTKDRLIYTVEIYDNKECKTINYNYPHIYLERLLEAGLPTKEHEDFTNFLDYIGENFDLNKLQMIQFEELIKTMDLKETKVEDNG